MARKRTIGGLLKSMNKIAFNHSPDSGLRVDKDIFKTIVRNAPLISIDLIVRNHVGQVLLGKRLNRPAKGFWFVPGGRIFKGEKLASAFNRLTLDELGVSCELDKAIFLGPYEHFYSDNFSSTEFSTHYVVLAYEISIDIKLNSLPTKQHGDYRWFEVGELLGMKQVHQHIKLYFDPKA